MSFLSRLRSKKHKNIKVVWLGLDQAGKSTTIKRLTQGIFTSNLKRTLGLNVEEYNSDNINMVCWDIGGQETFRNALWDEYIKDSDGVVYVIDSANPERFIEAKTELWSKVIGSVKNQNIPIAILANKQDLPEAVDAGKVAFSLELYNLGTHSYSIFGVSARTGENLDVAIEWLQERVEKLLKK